MKMGGGSGFPGRALYLSLRMAGTNCHELGGLI